MCVSEYKEHIKAFNELVAAKKGEYRVAVNSPTYSNESNNKAFVKAIRSLTPEEGAQVLDGVQLPNKPITWTKPETAQYVLFFLNYAVRDPKKIEESMVKSSAMLEKYIRPHMIGPLPPMPAHGVAHPRQLTYDPNAPAGGAIGDVPYSLDAAELAAVNAVEAALDASEATAVANAGQGDSAAPATGPTEASDPTVLVSSKAAERTRKEKRVKGGGSDNESESADRKKGRSTTKKHGDK